LQISSNFGYSDDDDDDDDDKQDDEQRISENRNF
jgi:hypothetical protein